MTATDDAAFSPTPEKLDLATSVHPKKQLPTSPKLTLSTTEFRIEEAVRKASDLKSLPVIVFELECLVADPRTSAQNVADLLVRDPVISSRILKTANSAHYGSPRLIGTLSQAIVLIGFQAVQNIALTVGVIEAMGEGLKSSFDHVRFWRHSVATAIAAERIAIRSGLRGSGAYMCGLLHDIGALVVGQEFPDLDAILHARSIGGVAKLAAERDVLGTDHAELGGRYLETWRLPSHVVEAVKLHHSETWDDDTPVGLPEVVQLADVLANALGFDSTDGSTTLPKPTHGLSDRLGYDEVTLSHWIDEISHDLGQAQEFFELISETD